MDGQKGTDDKLQPGLAHPGQPGESHDSDSLSSRILGMNIPRTNKIYEMVTKDACGIKPGRTVFPFNTRDNQLSRIDCLVKSRTGVRKSNCVRANKRQGYS